jgi:hypothetical protein
MATPIIAATAAAASQTFTIVAGTPKSILLIPAAGQSIDSQAEVSISYMNGSDATPIGTVRRAGVVLETPGTWRIDKVAGSNFGVVSEP